MSAAPAALMVPAPRTAADGSSVPALAAGGFVCVTEERQEVAGTASRRSQPRAWMRSVVWLVSAGLHPRACGTTVRVAEELAARMDYVEGRVIYDLDGTVRRLGVSRATVKRHVKVLRELGALVWLVHGSKRNLRLPARKYTATGTVYGAVIPPVYDEAMGHRVEGVGYEARVCGVTVAGRERAVADACRQQASVTVEEVVDNRRSRAGSMGCEPPSLGSGGMSAQVEVSGGFNYTRTRARNCPTARPESRPGGREKLHRSAHGRSRGRTSAQARRDIEVADQVRRTVSWVGPERDLRRLAFVLRPLIDSEPDSAAVADTLVAWSWTWSRGWVPQQPAAYIAARLAATGLRQAPTAAAVARQQQIDRDSAAARKEAAEAEAARKAVIDAQPCADCGRPASSGLCELCADRRTTDQLLEAASQAAAAAWADLEDPQDIEAVRTQVREVFHGGLEEELTALRDHGATEGTLASFIRLSAESAADDYQRSAVALLARTPQAKAEARQASEACLRAAHRHASLAEARQAAACAGSQARNLAAEHLLTARISLLENAPGVARKGKSEADGHPEGPQSRAGQIRAALQGQRTPRSTRQGPVKTRESACAGYRRALDAHLAAKQRIDAEDRADGTAAGVRRRHGDAESLSPLCIP